MPTELEQYFRFRCEKGLKARGLASKQEYRDRLNYEVDMIIQMKFPGYFLILMDILDWCKKKDIPVGSGRGSSSGSLACYCLFLTHLDPIKYNLIFERFINPERITLCDIDQDLCEIRREEVIQYIINKYGENNVAHIGTLGSMKAKGAIRDVCRTLGYDYSIGDKLSRLVLPPISGKEQTLSICYEKVPELSVYRNKDKYPIESEILSWADKFEGRLRNYGVHAAGLILADDPICTRTPLYPGGKEKLPTTQFDMSTVEECGWIKFDFLGLRALTTIDRCVKSVAKRHHIAINPLEIPVDDSKVYEQLASGDTVGVFQFEGSQGFQDLTIRIAPKCLEDLSLICALFRPGPLAGKLDDRICNVRKGIEEPQYLLPELELILRDTAGVLVYQEQMIKIARDLAGFSMGEGDILRKACGKKKADLMAAQREKFVSGMIAKGFHKKKAEELFELIQAFADYSFNYAHSISYGFIGYQMAWLKHYYPIEFICACLISDSDETEKVTKYIAYCKEKGINILPPDVNKSELDFSIDTENNIRFGLSVIKNLGKSPVKTIIEARKNGLFKNIIDFCNRVNLSIINRRKLDSLILSGSFDSTGHDRATLLEAADDIYRYQDERKRYDSKLKTYNSRTTAYLFREKERSEGSKKLALKKASKPKPPKEPIILESLVKIPLMDKLKYERDLLGFYISSHPVDLIANNISLPTLEQIKDRANNKDKIKVIVVPSSIEETTTKKNKEKMAKIVIEDKTGSLDIVAFPKTWQAHGKQVQLDTPAIYEIQLDILTDDNDNKNFKGRLISISPLRINVENLSNRKDKISFNIQFNKAIELLSLVPKESENLMSININLITEQGDQVKMVLPVNSKELASIHRKLKELSSVDC